MLVKIDGQNMVVRKFDLFIKAIAAKAFKGNMPAAKFLEKHIPAKSSETITPIMVINPPPGCTNKDCPDFNPEIVQPPIYGEEEEE